MVALLLYAYARGNRSSRGIERAGWEDVAFEVITSLRTPDQGLLRRLISCGGGRYARMILRVDVRDLTGGFKCIHRRVLEAIDLDSVRAEGCVFQIEVTYRALLAGFRLCEIPIIFRDRTAGNSKMSPRIAAEAMWLVPRLCVCAVEARYSGRPVRIAALRCSSREIVDGARPS